jgi:hypothetical protein
MFVKETNNRLTEYYCPLCCWTLTADQVKILINEVLEPSLFPADIILKKEFVVRRCKDKPEKHSTNLIDAYIQDTNEHKDALRKRNKKAEPENN